jgi:hypothetical protein
MSMAAGEYVSLHSQADTEQAALYLPIRQHLTGVRVLYCAAAFQSVPYSCLVEYMRKCIRRRRHQKRRIQIHFFRSNQTLMICVRLT